MTDLQGVTLISKPVLQLKNVCDFPFYSLKAATARMMVATMDAHDTHRAFLRKLWASWGFRRMLLSRRPAGDTQGTVTPRVPLTFSYFCYYNVNRTQIHNIWQKYVYVWEFSPQKKKLISHRNTTSSLGFAKKKEISVKTFDGFSTHTLFYFNDYVITKCLFSPFSMCL